MTKFTDLTKEQQEHFTQLMKDYEIPEGSSHLDINDNTQTAFIRFVDDEFSFWTGYQWSTDTTWVDTDKIEYYYPLPSPPYYVPEYDPFKESTNSPLDVQEGGNHYKKCKIQPIEYIHANNIGYLEGNVIKYVTRYKDKNGVEDIKKAMHYLELILEMQYGDN